MPLILPGNVASATAVTEFSVANSCRFNDDDTPYLTRTLETPSNRKKWTFSFWHKSSPFHGDGQCVMSFGTAHSSIYFDPNSHIMYFDTSPNNYRFYFYYHERDPAAWWHIVVKSDSTQATDTNRIKFYINGVLRAPDLITPHTAVYPAQNYDQVGFVADGTMEIGRRATDTGYYWDGYLAEVVFCDGQALAADQFGEFDETSPTIWKPIDVSELTFGNAGFYLDFEDSSDLGKDVSGNGNDFTSANLAAADQSTDTPTNNFCTINPLSIGANLTVAEGNLHATGGSGHNRAMCTHLIPSGGKWYWEVFVKTVGGTHPAIGVDPAITTNDNGIYVGNTAGGWGIFGGGGMNGTNGNGGTYASYTTGDMIGVAVDVDNDKIYFYKDGSLAVTSGTTYEPLTAGLDIVPAASMFGSGVQIYNFGQDGTFAGEKTAAGNADGEGYGNFFHSVPSGFLALCTKNMGGNS